MTQTNRYKLYKGELLESGLARENNIPIICQCGYKNSSEAYVCKRCGTFLRRVYRKKPIPRDYKLYQKIRVGKKLITDTVYLVKKKDKVIDAMVVDENEGTMYHVTHEAGDIWQLGNEVEVREPEVNADSEFLEIIEQRVIYPDIGIVKMSVFELEGKGYILIGKIYQRVYHIGGSLWRR